MSKKSKLLFAIPLILITSFIFVVTISYYKPVLATADSSLYYHTYGCLRSGLVVECDLETNKFNGATVTGHVERLSTINLSQYDPAEGVFGNALGIRGSRQQYLTVPNDLSISPPIFTISFWVKQEPGYTANSTVISHVNSNKTAGWIIESYTKNSQRFIQFSLTNSDSKTFSVSSPIEPGIFQNVVGVFDGKLVKIYVSGSLVNTIEFVGDYEPDPNVPLNIGLNSYDYKRPWNGVIDEVRLYSKAISDNNIHDLVNYGTYSQLPDSSSDNDGLIGYWSFDVGAEDKTVNSNNGKLIFPAASMVFSPDGRLFFSVVDAGEIRIMDKNLTAIEEPFVKLRNPYTNVTQQVHGITLDPDFSRNHYVYAYVNTRDNQTGKTLDRVLRFTDFNNKATYPKVLIDNISSAGANRPFAGALAFGPDEKLYIATGQDANLTGKVLRINSDGSIPADNPFPNSPVYTSGHRDMFGIAFDTSDGLALVTENGGRNYDEINVLKNGGNYGYPVTQPKSSSAIKPYQTDNGSAIAAARTYYKAITPTQAIFYDSNRFSQLKGLFLLPSYAEGSIYALSINKTGNLVEEIAIRLPEVRGHIVAIAQGPDGEIYLAGENIYKLISLDDIRPTPRYFIEAVKNTDNIQIKDMSLDLPNKVLSLNIANSNISNGSNDSNRTANQTSQSLRLSIPKALLGIIYEITSENYNRTSNPEDKIIENYNIKETRRVTNIGDTIIDIQLNNSNMEADRILIKGQSSTLVKPPGRNIQIQRG
jgi:glucose/arabinose dehydrogenase